MDGYVKTASTSSADPNPQIQGPGFSPQHLQQVVKHSADHFKVPNQPKKIKQIYSTIHSKPRSKQTVRGVY